MISKSAGSAIITLQDRKFVLRERVTLQREYVETRNKNKECLPFPAEQYTDTTPVERRDLYVS